MEPTPEMLTVPTTPLLRQLTKKTMMDDSNSAMDASTDNLQRPLWKRLPLLAQSLIMSATGVAILITPAMVDYFVNIRFDPNLNNYKNLRDYPSPWSMGSYSVFAWFIFLAIVWLCYNGIMYTTLILPDLLTKILELILDSRLETAVKYIDFLRILRLNVAFFFSQLVLLILFNEYFRGQPQTNFLSFGEQNANTTQTVGASDGMFSTDTVDFGTSATSQIQWYW